VGFAGITDAVARPDCTPWAAWLTLLVARRLGGEIRNAGQPQPAASPSAAAARFFLE